MKHSKICLAQTKPVRGDIATNIKNHIVFINRAIAAKTDLIIFPELSLTGYEPSLCTALAMDLDDARLAPLQELSNTNNVTIIVGAPIITVHGTQICAIIINPKKTRRLYAKQHLHEDELPYFTRGENNNNLIGTDPKIALAICYELTIPSHSKQAQENGADVYLTSVAKAMEDIERSKIILSNIAMNYNMPALMVNSIGLCEEYICKGCSTVWDKNGKLLGELSPEDEGILVYDVLKNEICFKWESNQLHS